MTDKAKNETPRRGDRETGRRGDAAKETTNRRREAGGLTIEHCAASPLRPVAPSPRLVSVAPSPRRPVALSPRRVAPSLILVIVFLLASCGPKRNAPVEENAKFGYCPVCGMQVNATDPFAAEIRYSDGTKLMFESPGDLLAFYTSPTRYSVKDWLKEKGNIQKVMLKDYNTREPIDASGAELVVKSRVDGPMGPDFFPFSTREAAELFASANGGTIIRLADVTVELVRELGRN